MKVWAKKTRRILKKVLSFGNALLLATVLASALSFYYSYFSGFESVDETRKVTQAQFSSTLADDVKAHIVNTVASTRRAEIAVNQGYFADLDTLEDLVVFMKHAWQVFEAGQKFGLASFYMGNDNFVYCGYSNAPLSAIVQYPGINYLYLLPIVDSVGTFNTTHMAESALLTLPFFNTDWPAYKLARELGVPIWSSPYIIDPQLPDTVYVTYAHPINYPNGTFCCIVFVDTTVSTLSNYLASLPIVVQAKGSAMILDVDLTVIATSSLTQKTLTLNLNNSLGGDRIFGKDVSNPVLAAGARFLEDKYQDGVINITTQIKTKLGKYFFQASTIYIPNGNKTMILITMQPRSYYFAKIDKMQVLIIIFSCFSLFTGSLYRILPVIKLWRTNKVASFPLTGRKDRERDGVGDADNGMGRARGASISVPLNKSNGSEKNSGSEPEVDTPETPGMVEGGVAFGVFHNGAPQSEHQPPGTPPLPIPRLLPPLQVTPSQSKLER